MSFRSSFFLIAVVLMISLASSFRRFSTFRKSAIRLNAIEVGSVNEIPVGERKIVDTSSGAVIVVNVDGNFYAVNAKCPHLGLPMKKAAVTVENGTPTITCNFHNSKFSLNDGSCSAWCTGALNIPGTGFIGKAMGNFGGAANSPATVYPVTVEDGKLFLDL